MMMMMHVLAMLESCLLYTASAVDCHGTRYPKWNARAEVI